MATELLTPCTVCGADLPERVAEASELLYGRSTRWLGENLLRALERISEHDDDDDETAGRLAVLAALDLTDFAALAQAFRHYGPFGECRR